MIRFGYADSRDGQVHYRTAGNAESLPVVFLHQTASSGAMFEKIMTRLGDRFRMIAFDTPGFGMSFKPETIPGLGWLADRLVEAIDDLGVGRFHLMGHHTGGCIALEIADRHPGRIATLGIMGPVVATDDERAEYRKTFVAPFRPADDGSHLMIAWAYLSRIGADRAPGVHHREMIDHLLGARAMPMAFDAVWNQDAEALYRKITAPLLLHCSKDDVLWPLFERTCALCPEAEVLLTEGMDFQPDNDPDAMAAGIGAFLAKHKGS